MILSPSITSVRYKDPQENNRHSEPKAKSHGSGEGIPRSVPLVARNDGNVELTLV